MTPAIHARPMTPQATAARGLPSASGGPAFALGLGSDLADHLQDPGRLASILRAGLGELADPAYRAGQRRVAPGIGPTLGVRSPFLAAIGRSFRAATRTDSPSTLLLVADRLLREPELEVRWFALGILERTLRADAERSWQLLRRAGQEAGDWITVDTLARPVGRGILAEPYRWAELEQLVFSPSRWERRLVGSTIATIPFIDHTAGREAAVAGHGLSLLAALIGDAQPEVQKSLSWAYRSLTVVDLDATTTALEAEAATAVRTGDGYRAWVVRDALPKLDPRTATRMRAQLRGLRRQAGTPPTSSAAQTAARFADLGLGRPLPEPPLT